MRKIAIPINSANSLVSFGKWNGGLYHQSRTSLFNDEQMLQVELGKNQIVESTNKGNLVIFNPY